MISFENVNSFYIVLGIVGVPVLVGFLVEAGKDLYTVIRKKDLVSQCTAHQYVSADLVEIKERQAVLREDRLPGIERKLDIIVQQQHDMAEDIKKLFSLWERSRLGVK